MTTPWDGSKAMDTAQSEIAALRAEVERARETAFREAKEDCRVSHTVEVQRITALQSEVEALRAEVERLKNSRLDPDRVGRMEAVNLRHLRELGAERRRLLGLLHDFLRQHRAQRAKDHARIDYERRDRARKAEAKLAQVVEAAKAMLNKPGGIDTRPLRDVLARVEQEGKVRT